MQIMGLVQIVDWCKQRPANNEDMGPVANKDNDAPNSDDNGEGGPNANSI